MKASNIYLHPTCITHPAAVAALESKTRCMATVVRRGRVVQLIQPGSAAIAVDDSDHPRPAA